MSCRIDGCEGALKARRLCSKHYHRLMRHGDPQAGGTFRNFRLNEPCVVDGCDKLSARRGMCAMHVRRADVHGDPLHGGRALMTIKDGYRLLYRPEHPAAQSSGYVYEHRVVMEAVLGRPLRAFENVHHINGVRTDNRPENLELWAKPQPSGQRVEDLVAWVISAYPREVQAATTEGLTCGYRLLH